MQKFILNIGHDTRSGKLLNAARIAKIVELFVGFEVTQKRVVVGEYNGKAEKTSVIFCQTKNYAGSVVFNAISGECDQECIAVVELGSRDNFGSTTAVGDLYGHNPSGLSFDWAHFRI